MGRYTRYDKLEKLLWLCAQGDNRISPGRQEVVEVDSEDWKLTLLVYFREQQMSLCVNKLRVELCF